jgi:hypothetical protein
MDMARLAHKRNPTYRVLALHLGLEAGKARLLRSRQAVPAIIYRRLLLVTCWLLQQEKESEKNVPCHHAQFDFSSIISGT